MRKFMNKDGVSQLSRRDFIALTGLSAAAVAFAPRFVFAQKKGIVPTMIDSAAQAKIETHTLRRNISVLEGSGGNIAVLTGKDGKLLIDSGFTVSKPRITEALNSLSSDPITQLINTHWHVDHTDGNAWVHSAGAVPKTVFDDAYRVHHNNTQIALKHYEPAHTDSDISVVFEEADIIHVGDTLWNGIYPFIDYSTGGSIDGTIRATEHNLSAVTDKTIVIPGHGPIGNKATLAEFRDMLVTIRSNVATLKKQGKSLSEAVAAKPTAAYDAKWGQFLITPAMFTGLVYSGV